MTKFLKRALCAVASCALLPAAAQAADLNRTYPAIANGMAAKDSAFGRSPATAAVANRRAVLIDASAATMYMLEGGRIVDQMKVIVGKPEHATPELHTSLTYATLNPYWHVPTDLARTLTAPNVLKHGASYLSDRGYEVLSHFGPGSQVIDPMSVDWKAVAAGQTKAYVRQKPGPANSMGGMKFSLAAGDGIYLHDTPRKELFASDNRNLSAGCVRLEDAARFASWLIGDVPSGSAAPEQHVAIRQQVPVVITYEANRQLAALQ